MAKLSDCISTVIDKMTPEEKGLLKCVISYGKKAQEMAGDTINSTEKLAEFGYGFTSEWASAELEKVFTEGFGFADIFKGIPDNYGKQLDIIINKVLVKSLKVTKPMFTQDEDSIDGAMQRERWITEKLMDSLVMNMDEDMKREMIKMIIEELKEKGVEPTVAAQVGAALMNGGLVAAKAILKFKFHMIVAQVANIIVKFITGKGLTFAANAALQKFVGVLFGPIGWVITAILALPAITALINPRAYDKYIPAVFIIGLIRISQEENM